MKLAENGKRIGAFLIDIIPITGIVFIIFYYFFGFKELMNDYYSDKGNIELRNEFLKNRGMIRNISMLIYILVGIFLDASTIQGSFGKMIMKIKIVDFNENRISLKTSIIRNISKIISALPISIGFIWGLFDKKRQTWHDKIAKTLVAERN